MVNEHGVLRIPALSRPPDFQFDSSLAGVEEFVLTPVRETGRAQTVSREQLESLL